MLEVRTIKKDDPSIPQYLNFSRLRAKGIDYIAKLAGKIWTDHNVHDPGITILEVLCYALTDLGYRTRLGIEDLLARKPAEIVNGIKDGNFFTPEEILSSNPTTILDYRKMLVDIEGVRNAWLEPATEAEVQLYLEKSISTEYALTTEKTNHPVVLNGLYKVFVELEPFLTAGEGDCADTEDIINTVLEEVNDRLHAHRNLGEDFLGVSVLNDEFIALCADIELKPDADPTQTLVEVFEKIQAFLSPELTFYTLEEMVDRGKSMEEIFEGRPIVPEGGYSHGFIDAEALEDIELRREIRGSDLYQVIMQTEGVLGVRDLLVGSSFSEDIAPANWQSWCLPLTSVHRPVLSARLSFSNIKLTKGVLPYVANEQSFLSTLDERLANVQKVKLDRSQLDASIPQGLYRSDLGTHYSIQNDFPLTYGIGEEGIADNAPQVRKSQALQLKAYLSFFDQLLANYLAQLSHIRDLFSIIPDEDRKEGQKHTYFTAPLNSVPEIERLIQFYDPNSQSEYFSQNATIATLETINSNDPDAPVAFKTPDERDASLESWIKAFKTDKISIGSKLSNGAYCFFINNTIDGSQLKSNDKYLTQKEAEKVASSLIFLGAQEQAYRPVNQQLEEKYGYQLVYEPQNYLDYTQQILESEDQYELRRDSFLNHLLARFSEQFTDYVLLMFALNGGQNDPDEIIRDKARFLSHYPDISRNRGKAFNYKETPVWDTENISGIESRVPRLMGVHDWKRQSMGNFHVVKREDVYYFELYDKNLDEVLNDEVIDAEIGLPIINGCPLLKSAKGFPSEAAAAAAFCSQETLDVLEGSESCVKTNCLAEQSFGFYFADAYGNPYLIHPASYATKEKRDEVLECVKNWLNGNAEIEGDTATAGGIELGDHTGWMPRIINFGKGFLFELFDDQGKMIFKSEKTYEQSFDAWSAFFEFLDLAQEIDHYFDTTPGSQQFSFVVKENQDATPIAKYPEPLKDPLERDKEKERVHSFIQSKNLKYTIKQLPDYWEWKWQGQQAYWVLNGARKYKDELQSLFAFTEALEYAEKNSFHNDENYGFSICKEPGLLLAISDPLNSEDERLAFKASLAQILDGVLFEVAKSELYELVDDTYTTLLQSVQKYQERQFALSEGTKMLEWAVKETHVQIKSEEGFCQWKVQVINDQDQPVAENGKLFDALEEAELVKQKIIGAAQQGVANVRTNLSKSGLIFHLKDEAGKVLLKSPRVYNEKALALIDFIHLLELALDSDNYIYSTPGFFTIRDKNLMPIGVTEVSSEPDQEIPAIIDFLSKYKFPLEISSKSGNHYYQLLKEDADEEEPNKENIWLEGLGRLEHHTLARKSLFELTHLLLEETDLNQLKYIHKLDKDKKGEEANEPSAFGIGYCFGFEVRDKDKNPIAEHPIFYPNKDERDFAIKELLEYINAQAYSFDVQNKPGLYQFILKWLDCGCNCTTLFEGTPFDNKNDAIKEMGYIREAIIKGNFILDNIVEVVPPDNITIYSFKLEKTSDPTIELFHPAYYNSLDELEHVILQVESYLDTFKMHQEDSSCGLFKLKENVSSICITGKVNENEGQQVEDKEYYGFQLKKEDFSLAKHPDRYISTEKRDQAVTKLSELAKTGELKYSYAQGATVKVENKFYFELSIGGKTLRGLNGFDTTTEAQNDLAVKQFEIIQAAKVFDHFKHEKDPAKDKWTAKLFNQGGEAIAKFSKTYDDFAECYNQINEYVLAAIRYPITSREEGRYGFQLLSPNNIHSIQLTSTLHYSTEDEAWQTFEHVLDLIKNDIHYYRTDDQVACIFKFEIGEVLLESCCVNEAEVGDAENDIEEVWSSVNDFLRTGQEENSLDLFQDFGTNCRYGFQYVSGRHQLVRYPGKFFAQQEASLVKDWIYQKVNCTPALYTLNDNLKCFKCPKEENSESYIINTGITIPNPPGSSDDLVQSIAWMSSELFPKDANESECRAFHIEVMNYAKNIDCYQLIKRQVRIDDEVVERYVLQLMNENKQVIADAVIYSRIEKIEVVDGVETVEISDERFISWNLEIPPSAEVNNYLEQVAKDLILQALQFPFFKEGDNYGFQLYCPEGAVFDIPLPKRCHEDPNSRRLIIEPGMYFVSGLYSSFLGAECALKLFDQLKKCKDNFRITGDEDCGEYGVELVDPNRVLAKHPTTYDNKYDRDKAIERVNDCLNVEGFHVLEHILLRPKTAPEKTCVMKGAIKVNCDEGEYWVGFRFAPEFDSPAAAQYYLEKIFRKKLEDEFDEENKDNCLLPCSEENPTLDLTDVYGNKLTICSEVYDADDNIDCNTFFKGEPDLISSQPTKGICDCFRQELLNSFEENPESELCLKVECVSSNSESLLDICIDPPSRQVSDDCTLCEIAPIDLEQIGNDLCKTDTESLEEQFYTSFFPDADPYSFWVTIVLPYWPKRFQNNNFRTFFETTLRKEAPAHVALQIAWISPKQMLSFERAYKEWLESISAIGGCDEISAKNKLIQELEALDNVYPPARLSAGIIDEESIPTQLNNSKLG